ncbi:MAG: hypothetical protein A3J62_00940 [Candidatus Buchananbacteria bacterium RIFCSPHIGHO2_02_FULL_38_8]|uniref:Uncharacterized protein n=2 Tax=Candidatus Buchananiibacteriota TaxID=1817903 RepID=A0A1G1XYT9_9BACT|nr:hypothetical protein [uncultured bacterium]OGY45121.1 MAG: hypothetical protein A2731_04005 [Candidatus Buchananbacteria bacterium RIFCSPHIGHO2_01_FULL_39_8]OGY47952.1 MAG: hypothetical protein A3J62_00940 [Candidatus Buchananbacteria bacterium RIFCSPHIGHO2_02_FULL_38_8]
MLDDKFFSLFDESLKTVFRCPVCSNRYNPIEAKILAERDNAHLIYLQCLNCQTAILAVILANNLGLSSVGAITDLTSEDVLKFQESEAVSFDDVIEMHQILARDRVLIDQII